MNILLLAPQPFFQERGTPIAVKLLIEELQTSGHSVELLTFHEGENVDLCGAQIHRIMSIPGISNISPGFSVKKIICDFLMMLKALRLCYRGRYDVIHAVEESIFIALMLKIFYKTPCIYDVDSWMSDQLIEKHRTLRSLKGFFTFFEKLAVKGSDAAVVVCKALEEKVRRFDSQMPVLLLEDVSLLEAENCGFESLREIVGDSGDILLYVGNLEKYQGIDLLLDAFALLLERNSKVNLVIIGGNKAGIEKYKSRAEDLAIASKVFFIGARPLERLAMYLKQADLLVSPRVDGENTPMKIYSYMASGTPVVATLIKSHTQVLDDSIAILAEPESRKMAAAFARGIEKRKYASEVGLSAKKTAHEKYSRSAFRKKITGFYSELSNVWNMRI